MFSADKQLGPPPSREELLALLLAEEGYAPARSPAIPRRSERGEPPPLSFAQQRLWFLQQLEPDSAFYNLSAALRLKGRLDLAALDRAIGEIVRRHEVLRTRFPAPDGEPRQVIAAKLALEIPVIDLSGSPAEGREAAAEALAHEEALRPFDLARGPLLRAKLLHLGPWGEAGADHILLFTLHHAIADGWSIDVLIREFAALYRAFGAGRPSPLPEPPIQYADYALWQRDELRGAALDGLLDYWRGQLDGAPALLELPTDRPRPPARSFRGRIHGFTLPKDLAGSLQALARREGATLFMVLLAAYAVLLRRHGGEDDLCVGTPVAGRSRVELENLIGCFVNTLALRVRLAGDPPFAELLARVREQVLGAQNHQDLPFEKLVEVLQPARNPSYSPLFQVMFVLQNTPSTDLELPGLEASQVGIDTHTAQYDLTLLMTERDGGLDGEFEYSTDLFDEDTVVRLARRFRTLLAGIVANPGTRLADLPLLDAAERRQVLEDWNATARPYPRAARLHELFEAQAARTPDALALVHGDQRLSYLDLNARANRLAHALGARGVGPEDRVALCLERSPELAVGILGILKAGGAYVPLDPAYPKARLAAALADSGAVLLVTEERLAAALPTGIPALLLDRDASDLAGRPDHDPPPVGDAENPAYVIYTSGSTGTPKGVVVSHRNAVHSTLARHAWYPEPVRGFLLLSSVAFDSSVAGIFWTLSQGGALCLPAEDRYRDVLALAGLIARERLTHLLCLPSLHALLLEYAAAGRLASLRAAIVAGEACSPAVVAKHRERLPHARLYNEYGPTEASVWCTACRLDGPAADPARPVPIGRPIPNTQVYLLDARLNPVPVGVPGELYVGGEGVTRGYLHRPELTAERFVPNPWAEPAGGRLYRTGDWCRHRADGEIEFLGRVDHQVKLRGFRIEPGEIEARLRRHPGVLDAAVVVRADTPGLERLVAYVASTEEPPPAPESLRNFVAETLPDYMVPAACVVLDRLPLTPNGKLDRKALPAPDAGFPGAPNRPEVAPRTPLEAQLAGLWRDLLSLDRVGVRDDFFELGGHSLLAVRLAARVRKTFEVDLPLAKLVERPCIEAQAVLIEQARAGVDFGGAEGPDLAADARLAPAIAPPAVFSRTRPTDPAALFLTGASGFLGAFLLAELAERTRADLYCLVRAGSDAEALDRLRATLRRYRLPLGFLDEGRVVPVPGDLARPRFGLPEARFRELSARIDAVYHCGAAVNFSAPYATLKPANVDGTVEVLRLALESGPKPIHYVSSTSIFEGGYQGGNTGFSEADFPDSPAGLADAYAQTKWVAESLMRSAAARGLPVTIYRPSFIIGDSRSGVWNAADYLCRLIGACIRLGKAPVEDQRMNMVPVDYVSRALVHLSGQAGTEGGVFHLTHPQPVSSARLMEWVGRLGYPIEPVPMRDWRRAMRAAARDDPEHPLYPLLADLEGDDPGDHAYESLLSCDRTLETLAQGGPPCPEIDGPLFGTYIRYLAEAGFIPKPPDQ
jgi:myxalamid-type nonribosomal peptide synthetase MxaA